MASIKYMCRFLIDENNLFEDSFIGHLKVMTVSSTNSMLFSRKTQKIYSKQFIAKEPPAKFCGLFIQLTNVLFDLCPQINEKVTLFNRLLKHWQGLLERVPNQLKYTAYLSCDQSLWVKNYFFVWKLSFNCEKNQHFLPTSNQFTF